MQRFLNLTAWDADDLRDLNLDYVIENLGDPDGILIADPTGFAKKGRKSAGVQRQYSGTLGRIDNCQIGTFLAFVNTAGDRVLIDRELYIPEQTWFGDRARCAEAAIPADLEFATRPAQVIAMITRSCPGRPGVPVVHRGRGVRPEPRPARLPGGRRAPPTSWRSRRTPSSPTPPAPPPRSRTGLSGCHRTRGSDVPAESGRRAPGLRLGVIDSDRPDHQYMIRRSVDDGELAFYHCYNPRHEPVGELVRVAGARWPIEECFQTGKGNVGLDNYQVRLYHAWYRHITLAMIAQSFLAVLAHRHHAKKGDSAPDGGDPHAPPPPPPTHAPRRPRPPHQAEADPPLRRRIRLTLAEIRRLFNLRDQAKHVIHAAMQWSTYRREHQADARTHHFRRRLKIQYLAL